MSVLFAVSGVDIPRNLAPHNQLNGGLAFFHAKLAYNAITEKQRASSCVRCDARKKECPQQIDIPAFMTEIAEEFK